MKFFSRLVSLLVAVVVVAACASTKVTDREILVTEKVPRPDNILIHDFAATPDDVPAYSPLASMAQTQQTPEQLELGRQAGVELATRLVERVRRMGLPAERALKQAAPQTNDIVIHGYIISVSEGSTAKRVGVGFGAGGSELGVAVEGYQMTAEGLRRLGSGTGAAGGSKTPGAAAPAGVALATGNPIGLLVTTGVKGYAELSGSSRVEGRINQIVTEVAKQMEARFRDQGWIK